MDKTAINLEQIRAASKAFISKMRGEGRFLRGALAINRNTGSGRLLRSSKDTLTFGEEVVPAGLLPGKEDALKTLGAMIRHSPEKVPEQFRDINKAPKLLESSAYPNKSLFHKIPEPYKFFNMLNAQLPPKSRLNTALIGRTPWNREAVNRWAIMHEAAEAGKHFIKNPDPTISRIATHLSTRPLLQDLNLAATSESGEFPLHAFAKTLRKMRRGKVAELTSRVPEIKRLSPGYQKINRSAQKHIQRLWEERAAV